MSDSSEAVPGAEQAEKGEGLQHAHQLSLKATQVAPDNLKAWLQCAETAPSIEEAVLYLNRANALQPLDPGAKQQTYRVVQKLLEQEPFILYLDETEVLYHVRNGEQISLVVPKDRAVPEAYPAVRPASLQNAYRWLGLAFLGLPLAGIGALVFAPLAAASALKLYFNTASTTNRIYSLVVILLAGGLWLVGLLLAVILLMHLIQG